MHPELLPQQLFVLRAKPSEVPHTDEWTGKVKAVVKRVESLETKMDEKLTTLQSVQSAQDAKLEKILGALQLLLPDDARDSNEYV